MSVIAIGTVTVTEAVVVTVAVIASVTVTVIAIVLMRVAMIEVVVPIVIAMAMVIVIVTVPVTVRATATVTVTVMVIVIMIVISTIPATFVIRYGGSRTKLFKPQQRIASRHWRQMRHPLCQFPLQGVCRSLTLLETKCLKVISFCLYLLHSPVVLVSRHRFSGV